MTVRVVDRGAKKRVKQLTNLAKTRPEVTVGIHAAEGAQEHKGSQGTTVLEVAIWNEFGTSRIPERSFLRAWFDENKERLQEFWKRLMRSVAAGKYTKEQAMQLFGQQCVGEIQQRIANGIPPPNAESTIRQKGGGKTTPLVDTGQLRSSISYQTKG